MLFMLICIPCPCMTASVQPSQPPKTSIALGPPPASRIAHLTRLETRQVLCEKVNTAIQRRTNGSKNTNATTFPPPPPSHGRRSKLTTAPRLPLSLTVALHNAERRINLIPSRERYFRTRPRPAARGKRILSKVPVLSENEVYPPPPAAAAPPLLGHTMVRTKATRPRPRPRRPATDENTVP